MKQKPGYKTDFITDYALDWLDNVIDDDSPFSLMLPYHMAHYPLQAREEDIQTYRGKYTKDWDCYPSATFRTYEANRNYRQRYPTKSGRR